MKEKFLHIAKQLNEKLNVLPLLFGSLGLGQRLGTDLNADDIDVLVPEAFLGNGWDCIVRMMEENGCVLYDAHEHAFEKDGVSIAFAAIESLVSFAGVDIKNIPIIEENGVKYLLLDLRDYLKVYTASLKDGYRKNVKNKNDQQKIDLINQALSKEE